MNTSKKEKIINNLQQAKQAGQLKTENIKEIVRTAVSEAVSEMKEGREEISSLVQEAIAAVVEIFQGTKEEIKDEVTASIEGAIEGISSVRRKTITHTQSEIKTLETKIEAEEKQLQQEVDLVLSDLQEKSQDESANLKAVILSAIDAIKNSEEIALLQKRYAQLKTQLAIVQANLASRYGENYENVNQYLDDAKTWYERARDKTENFTGKVEEKQQKFEEKLGEAGSAIALKERQLKHILRELGKSLTEIFRDL